MGWIRQVEGVVTQNKPNRAQRNHNQGYEPGSLAAILTPQQRRQMNEWLKRKRQDAAVYERQLRVQG